MTDNQRTSYLKIVKCIKDTKVDATGKEFKDPVDQCIA